MSQDLPNTECLKMAELHDSTPDFAEASEDFSPQQQALLTKAQLAEVAMRNDRSEFDDDRALNAAEESHKQGLNGGLNRLMKAINFPYY